jgi:hypothetical protein
VPSQAAKRNSWNFIEITCCFRPCVGRIESTYGRTGSSDHGMESGMIKMLGTGEIQQRIEACAEGAKTVRIAAPFWGEDAVERLGLTKAAKGRNFKLICNLESGACNPEPIARLQSELLWEARTNKQLHAKVYIFDETAIVGSANPSANGLALQGNEVSGWSELCIETRDKRVVGDLAAWFDRTWRDPASAVIDPKKLKEARKEWNGRRRGRPLIGAAKRAGRKTSSFLEYVRKYPERMSDRGIFIITYRSNEPDSWAKKRYRIAKKERRLPKGYSFYQDWSELKPGSTILDYAYVKGKPKFFGMVLVPDDAVVKDNKGTITLVKDRRDILGLRLSNKDHSDLKRMVGQFLASEPARVKNGTAEFELEITRFLKRFDLQYVVGEGVVTP